jgi:hypothetical protein
LITVKENEHPLDPFLPRFAGIGWVLFHVRLSLANGGKRCRKVSGPLAQSSNQPNQD